MSDCQCCDDLSMDKCNPCKNCRRNPCQNFEYLAKDKPIRCDPLDPLVQCCPSSSCSESSSSESCVCCPESSSSSCSSSSSSSCVPCKESSSSSSSCAPCKESSSSSSSSSECERKKCNYCLNDPCGDHSLSSILDSLESSCQDKHHDKDKKKDEKKDDKKDCDSKYHKSREFIITFGEGSHHYWSEYNTTCREAIYVNGKVGPIIHLYRGYSYSFKVDQRTIPGTKPEHYFVLTKCPDGGKNDIIPGGFEPIACGCGFIKVDERTPRFFFYHDARHRYLGGVVLVHDKYPSHL